MVKRGWFASRVLAFLGAAVMVVGVGCSGADGKDGSQGPAGPAGVDGNDGQDGDPGKSGTDAPSISAIVPGQAFLERTIDVTISGYGTTWTDAAQVDFGAGVTVNSTIVASPTAIVANITLDGGAATGPRDVKVTEGSANVVYKGAFKVDAPLVVTAVGTQAQGSILTAHVKQLDISTPFDTTTEGDGLFTPISYPNVLLGGSTGVFGDVGAVSSYGLDGTIFVDVTAAAGPTLVGVISGPAGDEVSSLSPSGITVAARTPVALSDTAATTGTVAGALDTALYVFTPPAGNKNIEIEVTTTSTDGTPKFALLPKSGSFADLISYGATGKFSSKGADPLYVVFWDNTGAKGYEYSFSVTVTDAPETEPNDTCAMAEAGKSLPLTVTNASLTDENDQDWFSVTVDAADIGKSLHIVTSPGDEETDTVVELFAADCTTLLGASEDSDYHEDFTSDPITEAGTYYVKVSNSTFGFGGSFYNLDVTVE